MPRKKHWSQCKTEAEEARWWDENPGYMVELMEAAAAAGRLARGKRAIAAVDEAPPPIPEQVDVRAIRTGCGLGQAAFARRYGFSPRTVQDWEQGRRKPRAAARAYLTLIRRDPKAVESALRKTA
jgi:putative transcriptional regulator